MLVKSSPADRATSSRVVFQMLIDGAVSGIDISTPYFLPDKSLRRSLVRAARRGVRVRVIVPGPHTDQNLVRLASRRMYGELLGGGIRIFYRAQCRERLSRRLARPCAIHGGQRHSADARFARKPHSAEWIDLGVTLQQHGECEITLRRRRLHSRLPDHRSELARVRLRESPIEASPAFPGSGRHDCVGR
jgi:hypothetical protein